MPIVPSSEWSKPAETWGDIIDRYVLYVQVPTWRAKALNPDGSETSHCTLADAAASLSTRLHEVIEGFVQNGGLLASPYQVETAAMQSMQEVARRAKRRSECPQALIRHTWRALVFYRDQYTCRYCRRTAWGVYEESRRTIRLELDHLLARARLTHADDYDGTNIVVACRACNDLKGQMEEKRLVMPPRRTLDPLECSDGTSPRYAMSSRG